MIDEHGRTIVSQLLDKGNDPSIKNNLGETPLWVACRYGTSAAHVVHSLLAHQPSFDANKAQGLGIHKGMNPLHIATYFGHTDMVEALLDHGKRIDVDALTDQGKNALALAIDKGYMDIARLLFHRTSGTEHRRSAHFWHPENQEKDCNWTAGRTGGRERSGWVASFPCTDRGQRYAARFFDPKRNTGCEKEASKLRDDYRERCREESREYDRKRIADWNI